MNATISIILEDFTSEEMLRGYLAGEVPEKRFIDTMLNNILNVEFFIAKLCDYTPETREKVVSLIRDQSYRIVDGLMKVLSKIDEGKHAVLEYGFSEEDLESIFKKHYDPLALDAMRRSRKKYSAHFMRSIKIK